MRTVAALAVLVVAGLALSDASRTTRDIQSRIALLTDIAQLIICTGRAAVMGFFNIFELIQQGHLECWRSNDGKIIDYLHCIIDVLHEQAAHIDERIDEYYDAQCRKNSTYY